MSTQSANNLSLPSPNLSIFVSNWTVSFIIRCLRSVSAYNSVVHMSEGAPEGRCPIYRSTPVEWGGPRPLSSANNNSGLYYQYVYCDELECRWQKVIQSAYTMRQLVNSMFPCRLNTIMISNTRLPRSVLSTQEAVSFLIPYCH
jgi:hypothetical protein